MLVRSLQTKSRKRLARDVLDTFSINGSLVEDLADTDRWPQNLSTHGRVLATFKRRFLTTMARN